jgi:hypothetical protein
MAKKVVGNDVTLKISSSNDNRSYHISSEKILNKIGFATNNSIEEAMKDVKTAIENRLLYNSLSNPRYFNIKMMQNINLK